MSFDSIFDDREKLISILNKLKLQEKKQNEEKRYIKIKIFFIDDSPEFFEKVNADYVYKHEGTYCFHVKNTHYTFPMNNIKYIMTWEMDIKEDTE